MVHDTVDEQGGGAKNLARRLPAGNVPADPLQDVAAGPVLVEAGEIESELCGITP